MPEIFNMTIDTASFSEIHLSTIFSYNEGTNNASVESLMNSDDSLDLSIPLPKLTRKNAQYFESEDETEEFVFAYW